MQTLCAKHPPTALEAGSTPRVVPAGRQSLEAEAILRDFAGTTFADGLYRIHHDASGTLADQRVNANFPWLADRVFCLGFNWLGMEFALDFSRSDGEEPLMLLIDPGYARVAKIPFTAKVLHEEMFPNEERAGLFPSSFQEWQARNPAHVPLNFDECVGLVIPPCLGGTDDTENLARTPIDVYWDLQLQIAMAVREVPEGTPVETVTLEPEN